MNPFYVNRALKTKSMVIIRKVPQGRGVTLPRYSRSFCHRVTPLYVNNALKTIA